MPRPPRLQVAGLLNHVYSRGNARQPVVLTDTDCEVLVATLGEAVIRSGWICVAYCVMPNHYHALLLTPEPNLAKGMQWLNGTYARRFNSAHERDGHLWQGRYGSKPVTEDDHLMRLLGYLPMNPVSGALCIDPAAYRWSSYAAIAGHAPPPPFLDVRWTLELFSDDVREARRMYALHVRETPSPFELASILDGLDPVGIQRARAEGFTLREIAEHLGVSIPTIWRRCKNGV
jgi:REP element-mobilizing transposase RayT